MTMDSIIAQLDAEIARLQEVKKLLLSPSSLAVNGVTGTGSPAAPKARRKKRTLSAEARSKIADAQRKRWAAEKAKK